MTSAPAASPAELTEDKNHEDGHAISPVEIALGVVISRSSEFFDFFVFAIASVLVFPARIFPFADQVTGTLYSFCIFALAFLARPVGTVIFTQIDKSRGQGAKLTLSLLILGTATVCMGFIPSYDTIGSSAIWILAILRIAQGLALAGAWDGTASLLAASAPAKERGFYAMVPQLGAPIGLIIAALLFTFLTTEMGADAFLDWGWRYPFFVAFAINVVALFARLRIVATPEYDRLFAARELEATSVTSALANNGRAIVAGSFVPLASFAMFHMVTVFALCWVFLFTEEAPGSFLMLETVGAFFCFGGIWASGMMADKIGRRTILAWGAFAIAVFALVGPVFLAFGGIGQLFYMVIGFLILGFSFGQCSGVAAPLFDKQDRYTSSALASDIGWLFGAGFAPLVALGLTAWLGLWAAGLYLLSGAAVTYVALWYFRKL